MMTTKEYLDRMQKQVEEWSEEINRLKEMVNEISSDARSTYLKKIDELQDNRDKMLRRINAITAEMAVT